MQRGLTVFGDEESPRNLKGLVQWAYCWINCCNIKERCELLCHVRKNKDRYINRSSEDFEFHMNTRMNEYIMLYTIHQNHSRVEDKSGGLFLVSPHGIWFIPPFIVYNPIHTLCASLKPVELSFLLLLFIFWTSTNAIVRYANSSISLNANVLVVTFYFIIFAAKPLLLMHTSMYIALYARQQA